MEKKTIPRSSKPSRLLNEHPVWGTRLVPDHQKHQGDSLRSFWIFTTALLLTAVIACNQPFDPRAPYQDRLVVYSVLSNDRDQQFLRLSTTYQAPNFNPSEVTNDPALNGAVISLVQAPGTVIPFRDTVMARVDTSRYADSLHVYVASFRPDYSTIYQLTVQAPGGLTATGFLHLPAKAYLSYTGTSVLRTPADFEKGIVSVYTTLSDLAGGYVVRMVLQYTISDGLTTFQELREVPIEYRTEVAPDGTVSLNLNKPVFPTLRRVQSVAITTQFGSFQYVNTLLDVQKEYLGKSITFERAIFLVMQADPNFFKYYSVTNGFQDSVSIRLDQPLYSNISGGTGLFGGYIVDTLSFQYDALFPYNR